MIASSYISKPEHSKTDSNADEKKKTPELDAEEHNNRELYNHQKSTSVSFSGKEGRYRSRGRITEFRSSRGEKRGAFRSRGTYSNRADRESSDFSHRYNDGMKNSPDSSSAFNSKYYDKDSNLTLNLPEDPRISKLLRRLCAESDIEKSLVICNKLQEAIMIPDNARYIRRSYEILVESLLDTFYDAPGPEIKENAAIALGRIGYVMGPDYQRHLDWLMSQYQTHNTSIKRLLMLSISETFSLDTDTSELNTYASNTMEKLQTIIEATDSANVFMAAIDSMIVLSSYYPDDFAKHFVDIVDILVGWHVDSAQTNKVKEFALESLLKLSRHWQADVTFSISLLNQFLEDMSSYANDLQSSEPDNGKKVMSHQECMEKIIAFIKVFNTVVRSLGEYLNPNLSQNVKWAFLTESMSKILQVMIKVIDYKAEEEMIISGNLCIIQLLKILQSKLPSSSTLLFELIEQEIINYLTTDDAIVNSVLELITKTIKEVSSNLPLNFIKTVIGPNSSLKPLRYSENKLILEHILIIYTSLLNLKNIPLLQETYKYVLSDIQNAFSALMPNVQILQTEYHEELTAVEAERNIIFYLQCLSDLANASNSIIGMWALQPSILELLALKMIPHEDWMCKKYPAMQYSILYLLYSHCKKNNYFIASSDLVTTQQRANVSDLFGIGNIHLGNVSSTSPTSGHLGIIFTLLGALLNDGLPEETLTLTLRWISDILHQLKPYLHVMSHSNYFVVIVTNMIIINHRFNSDVIILVLKNILFLMRNKILVWNAIILRAIASMCLLHSDNSNSVICQMSMKVLCEIQWDILQVVLDKHQVSFSSGCSDNFLTIDTKFTVLKEYLIKTQSSVISAQHFKTIMNLLLTSVPMGEVDNVFVSCWPIQNQDFEELLLLFRECALNFRSVKFNWALTELANCCINMKLRTPLGKPPETFMHIENIIKKVAKEALISATKCNKSSSTLISFNSCECIRIRLITEFMMILEKGLYNAFEGAAVVLPPVSKPVRTFFNTNKATCKAWLTRVRQATVTISLYCGHYGAAVYNGQMLLLASLDKPNLNVDIESMAINISKALVKFNEPEALHGLYIWIKQTFDKKISFLKAASEQSNGRYESALEHYKKLMKSVTTSDDQHSGDIPPVQSGLTQFIRENIQECLKNVQDWNEMQQWSISENNFTHMATWHTFVTSQNIEEHSMLEIMSNWDVISGIQKEFTRPSCTFEAMLNTVESSLIFAALKSTREEANENLMLMLDDIENVLNEGLTESVRNNFSSFAKNIVIQQEACHGLKKVLTEGKCISNPFMPSSSITGNYGCTLENFAKIVYWHKYFTKLNMTEENIHQSELLSLHLVKLARKHLNVNMANRELLIYFRNNHLMRSSLMELNSLNEISEVLLMSPNAYDLDIWSVNNAIALTELCKVVYSSEDDKMKAINLCASISLAISQRLAIGESNYDLREKGTRLALTLSKWVQNEGEAVITNAPETPLAKLIAALPEIGLVDNNISENVIPVADTAVGKLLQLSVNQCPGLSKSWASFASWCFRWGRKMVEYSSKTGEQLTDSDKQQIENIMIGCSARDYDAICDILSKTKATCDDEDIDWNEINTSEMIENKLRTVPALVNAFPEHIAMLVDIWRQAQKRVFSYYELSADAYFKFLQLICASDFINHSGEYSVVTATLRLLKLIVKHAMELQTVLESGLANTPTHPWKVIIPQLFSRLNHPETYVKKCVSDLLCRLAEDAPHLITFPAVVGAVENEQIDLTELSFPKSFLSNCYESEGQSASDSEDNESEEITVNNLNSCFLDMVETLSKQAPETILQVKLFVRELQRINLLWDELWLGTLAQHHSDFTKRLGHLEYEINKVKNNSHLTNEDKNRIIKEKHKIIFEPVVSVLEQLNRISSRVPETPHEKHFQVKFQTLIAEIIEKITNPTNPEKPQECWVPLKQLQLKLQQKVNKRTSYILKMCDISPVLYQMKNTVISMPGVHANQSSVRVTVESIENNVAILPTKTKPKKLILNGSNGRPYTYLFKGLEDLHLDERIMQFLSIANTMMARDSESDDNQTYRARHYSVIPLGPRSGLISWVDNVTPLFALYKRWQSREAALQTAKTNKTVNVLRPSELFYNKLNPLLQAAGISTENRKDWPIDILKQVLTELTAETPSDLLWKELWCSSISPDQWWCTVRRYSYSVAVMSTIGYIIGLGDRHLDNVLVDLSSGEVVHIDYNVCFEKGKTLRVPEKVPFRLTPNLVAALGVTGVEGIFRLACEHVLKTMRRGRETLLTLLEAFVVDPLVEWGGARKRRAPREPRQAARLLPLRCQEMEHDWNETRDLVLSTLPAIKEKSDIWLKENEKLKTLEKRLDDCDKQMELVKEIQSFGNNLSEHPLYCISQKYTSYKQAKNAVNDSMKALVKILNEFDTQIENYKAAQEAVNGPQIIKWIQEFSSTKTDEDDEPIFDHIKEFLTNAGQSSMVTQCEQAEIELKQCLRQTGTLVKTCLDLLSQYAAVAQYFPKTQTEHHKIVMFRNCIASALETKSPQVCRDVSAQVSAIINSEQLNNAISQQILNYHCQLQAVCAEATAKLNKAYEKLQLEGGEEAIAAADAAYFETKSNLANWVRSDEGAVNALECVVINMLCSINRRFLMLEGGAQSAGECLIDLTSREGEWFLDDMNALSMQAVELFSLIPVHSQSVEDCMIPAAVECVRNASVVISDLVELNFNFNTIILPETLRKVHAEEPSVLSMIQEMNNIIIDAPCPLNDLLAQLEVRLRYSMMEMESPGGASGVLAAVEEMRSRLVAVAGGSGGGGGIEGGACNEGRVLAMGFNGLFGPLAVHWAELMARVPLPLPPACKKIDHLNLAMDMCASVQNEGVRAVLEDIFLVKRIQLMVEVLNACVLAARGEGPPPDEDRLTRPLKRWVCEWVSRCLLGVHSYAVGGALCLLVRRAGLDLRAIVELNEIGASWKVSLESVCEKVGSGAGAGGGLVERAGSVAGGVERARRRRDALHARLRARVVAAAHARHACLRLAAHAARHAHHHPQLAAIALEGGVNGVGVCGTALGRTARELAAAGQALSGALAAAQPLLTAAHQRVRWGVGANPLLAGVGAALEGAWARANERGAALAGAAGALSQHARSLHALAPPPPRHQRRHHPAAATTLKALAHWEKACVVMSKYELGVSEAQEALLELLHPEPAIDQQWVESVAGVLGAMREGARDEWAGTAAAVRRAARAVRRALGALAAPADLLRAALLDTRPLLHTLALHRSKGGAIAAECLSKLTEVEEALEWLVELAEVPAEEEGSGEGGGASDDGDGGGGGGELDEGGVLAVMARAELLAAAVPDLTRALLRFEGGVEMDPVAPAVGAPGNDVKSATNTGGGESVQGAAVWKRVRLKLEGRDPDPTRRRNPHEQVEVMIKEARNEDNLCLMYEGWMAWV